MQKNIFKKQKKIFRGQKIFILIFPTFKNNKKKKSLNI